MLANDSAFWFVVASLLNLSLLSVRVYMLPFGFIDTLNPIACPA
jgi:hypothetical protein